MTRPDGDDVHALIGPYVLDALDDVERAAFRRHLSTCAACAIEAAELQATATELAALTATEPPRDLRSRVLAEITRTPQQQAGIPRQRAPRDEAPTAPVVERERPRRVWLVAACLALVAAVGGVYVVQEQRVADQRDRLATSRADADRIAAVLGAPDVRMRTATSAGARIVVAYSAERRSAVATLVAPPPGGTDRAYQLWVVTGPGQAPRSAGVLAAGASEATTFIPDVSAQQVIAVTKEPAGGSVRPTLPLVVFAAI